MVGLSQQSPFVRAFYDYLHHLPEKKTKQSMLSRIDIADPPTPEKIQEAMRQMESKHGQKTSVKMMRRVLGPVVTVLKDYYGILDTLCQADPTPGMVLWGALKIVIDGLGRFIDLFDKIKGEVLSMSTQLRRLILYEDLYGSSADMQEYLFNSYKDVFRFWCRVDKECNRCSLNALLRASASFSMKKLQGIVADIQHNADQLDKLVPIIEGQYASQERLEATIERGKNQMEREEGSAWRKQMQSDRIRSWLGGQMINESNLRRQQNNISPDLSGDTYEWLLTDCEFQKWVEGSVSRPALWLFAGPGSGKSVLCSQVSEHIKIHHEEAAMAVHFYEFDNQRTALSTAQILATQLFEKYWLLNHDIPKDLVSASQKSDASLINIFEFTRLLVAKLPKVFLFIDGLDEELQEARWKEAVKVIDFVNLLATTSPSNVRVWYSSQDRFAIREKLKSFPVLDIKEHVKIAVDNYVTSTVPGINNPEVDRDTRDWILTELKKRANGNFLWASLMLKTIENEVNSFNEMEQFINEGLPQDLDGYYTRILAQYETSRERDLACKIFALITFAKRRLRLNELREAIGMISSRDKESLNARNVPWRQAVEKLLSPLVETQQDPDDPEDYFCHLFHSTVKTFLQRNANILDQSQPGFAAHVISEATIGNACLQYLSQTKYAQILTRNTDRWLTRSGENVHDHHFLSYSAKYWDKHLDEVEGSPALRQRIEEFLTSSNFVTTLQIQSLYVEGHFSIYTLNGYSPNHKYAKRVFPKWFTSHTKEESAPFSKDYRSFITEWNSFLHSASCIAGAHHGFTYQGELDRCLWKALGPRNFLSRTQGRYTNFILASESLYGSEEKTPYCESIAADGTEIAVLRMSKGPANDGKPLYRLETWSLIDSTTPNLVIETMISAKLDIPKWTNSETLSNDKGQLASRRVVSCSPDLAFLRIGHQLFSKDRSGEYIEVNSLSGMIETASSYFEDITNRGRYLVLTSRGKPPASSERRGGTKDQASRQSNTSESVISTVHEDPPSAQCNHGSDTSLAKASDGEEERSEEASDPTASEESEWNSAEESWSEGSTEADQDEHVPWNTPYSSEESHEGTSTSEAENEDESEMLEDEIPVHSFGQLKDESESDGGDIDFDCGSEDDAYEADSDFSIADSLSENVGFDSDDDDIPMQRCYLARRPPKPAANVPRGLLTMYDLQSENPVQIFKFSQPLPIVLYGSPPVIHSAKPLVVWPLCGGEVLFADFEGKTYFVRKARPSTPKTRHISMKCCFSPCGNYLHMVSLEAQQQSQTKAERKANGKPPLLLSAFISTHRLSSRKTSRSPPTLIHRAKVSLGSTNALCPTRMPVEVTWALKEVYLSSSSNSNQLVVFRVDLFASPKSNDDETNAVSVPRQIILLPESARSRSVYFFPQRPEDAHALILIGSWKSKFNDSETSVGGGSEDEWDCVRGLPETVAPPIGFYVHKEKDLGGWGPSNAVADISRETDKGQLKQKMERFVGEDDCGDLETYFIA